ncbi:MAG: DNA polymerase III subunit delta', partial [Alphaproteobacteria bacterium]
MSVEKPDNLEPAPPRETGVLYGHGEAEQALLGAYRSSRFPHAWLIAGPAGIGK